MWEETIIILGSIYSPSHLPILQSKHYIGFERHLLNWALEGLCGKIIMMFVLQIPVIKKEDSVRVKHTKFVMTHSIKTPDEITDNFQFWFTIIGTIFWSNIQFIHFLFSVYTHFDCQNWYKFLRKRNVGGKINFFGNRILPQTLISYLSLWPAVVL